MTICPKCGSDDVAPSRSHAFERLARYFLFHRPYRCRDCWHRFRVFENPLRSLAGKVVFGIILLVFLLIVFSNYAQKNYYPTRLKKVQRPIKKSIVVKIKQPELISKQEGKASSPQEIPPETLKSPKKEEKAEIPVEIVRGLSQTDETPYRLKDIEVQSSKKQLQVLFLIENPEIKYTYFFLAMPPRLVVDFKGKWDKPPKKTITVNDDIAKNIRVGRHTDKLRLVLDLRNEKNPSVVFKVSPQGLILILRL
ncbi:AMIN domain-containing protein [Thermodesulfobacteriota bacterium]